MGEVYKKDGSVMNSVERVVDTGDGYIRVDFGGVSKVVAKSEVNRIVAPVQDTPKK